MKTFKVIVILLMALVCGDVYAQNLSAQREIRVLSIGNSYSRDAFSYVPFIMHGIAPDVKLTFGIMYFPGMSLKGHLDRITDEASVYEYDKFMPQSGAWKTVKKVTAESIVKDEPWDIVILQQASTDSKNFATYQPYLDGIINWLYGELAHPVRLGWLLTPAYPTGYSLLNDYGITSDGMFNMISGCAKRVVDSTPVDFVIPCGTAVQNARCTPLDSVGNFRHLSFEGRHLQEGLGCQVEAYVAVLSVLSMTSPYMSIFGDRTRVTSDWVVGKNIPGPDGKPVGSTDANCAIAQKCAVMAFKHPFEITRNIR